MKNIIHNNFIQIVGIVLGFMLMAPAAFAGNDGPVVETIGPARITEDSVMMQAFFSSRDAEYYPADAPYVVFEYGEDRDVEDGATEPLTMYMGSSRVTRIVQDLEPDETYYYRAVMYTEHGIMKGDIYRFRTLEEDDGFDLEPLDVEESNTVINADDNTETSSTSSSSSTSPVVTTTTTTPSSTTVASSGSSSVATRTVTTSGPVTATLRTSDNLLLTIENGEDEVRQGETVSYEIELENISDVELENVTVVFEIPEEMNVQTVAGARSNERDGKITMNIGDMDPGDDETITIIGRMRGRSTDDQVIARVDAFFGVGDVRNQEIASNFDIDEYNGVVTNSVLGASAIGAGFLPTNLLGWILLMVILVGLFYAARWYFYHRKQDAYPGYPYDEPQYS